MSATETRLPEVDGAACVHALAPHASCRACVDVCPRQAWVLDDDGLGLDTSLCDACGLCVPVCPRGAIDLPRPVSMRHDAGGNGSVWLACEKAGSVEAAALPCLHSIGVADFDRLAADDVRTVHVLAGDCALCDRAGRGADIFAAGALHAALRASRGMLPVSLLKAQDRRAFDRALARAREDMERIDRGRRRLFGVLRSGPQVSAQPQSAAPLARFRPSIEPALCVACDACIRICPDGALGFGTQGKLAYVVKPERCSGCRLCLDICDRGAVTIASPGPAEGTEIALDSARCKACGAPYSRIAAAGGGAQDLCRICARVNHHKNLFQVLGNE